MQQQVGTLQGQMQINERQAPLALQSQADLHNQKMIQLQADNQTQA